MRPVATMTGIAPLPLAPHRARGAAAPAIVDRRAVEIEDHDPRHERRTGGHGVADSARRSHTHPGALTRVERHHRDLTQA